MTDKIINLSEEREKRMSEEDFIVDILEKSGLNATSLKFMKSTIELLYDNGIDPRAPETAENMIFISMLFQAHLDNMNGTANCWYKIFDNMRSEVMDDE